MNNKKKFKQIWAEQCKQYKINEQPSILPKTDRIIVIGDLHGDLQITFKTLEIAKVIDTQHKWIGGNTIVVQVGDQIDRCRFDGKNSCNQKGITNFDEHSDIRILKYLFLLKYLIFLCRGLTIKGHIVILYQEYLLVLLFF